MASFYCGTGGCTHVFHAAGHTMRPLAKGGGRADLPPFRGIQVQVHGTGCGGTNLNACVEAVVVDQDGFQSIR